MVPGPSPPPLKIGTVTRRPLPDGRPYPAALAVRQVNAAQVALLEDRIDAATLDYLRVGTRNLTRAERTDLADLLRTTLLPEIHDPAYRPDEDPMSADPAPPAPAIPELEDRAARLRRQIADAEAELDALDELHRLADKLRELARFPSLVPLIQAALRPDGPPAAAAEAPPPPPTAPPPTNADRVRAWLVRHPQSTVAAIAAGSGVKLGSVKDVLGRPGRFERHAPAPGTQAARWSAT